MSPAWKTCSTSMPKRPIQSGQCAVLGEGHALRKRRVPVLPMTCGCESR
jgi:hypothetical protein